MKNTLILILVIFFLNSCSKNDYFNTENFDSQCKVIGTNGYPELEYDPASLTGIPTGKTIYEEEYIYNSNNQLTDRVHINNINDDKIEYDSNGRISKISTFITHLNYTTTKLYEYTGSNTLPLKIARYKVKESENLTQLTYTEILTYNNKKQLINVLRNYIDNIQNSLETIYKYNSDGNLTEINANSIDSNNDIEYSSIETFENYDTFRNPFKGLPFSDLRGISESDNNYMEYYKTSTVYSEQYPNGIISESSGYSITPTDLNYLEKSLYQCDE